MNSVELYNASVDVLNASVAVLDASSPLRAPERRYVSVGEPAFDCDQLTVSASVRPGLVATNSVGLDAIRSNSRPRVLIASFRVTVVRCGYPTVTDEGDPPDDADIEAAAAAIYADGWVLFDGLNAAARAGTIGGVSLCSEWSVDALDPVGAEGAVAGWVVSAQAMIPGSTG